MAQKKIETDEEFKLRNAFEALLRQYPEDIVLSAELRPNKESYGKAQATIDSYWGKSASVLKLFVSEGRNFGVKQGVDAESPLQWWVVLPKYSDASEKWDLLVAYKPIVEYILKFEATEPNPVVTPLTNSRFNNRLRGDEYAKFVNSADDGSREVFLNVFDRIVLLILHYNFMYSTGMEDSKRPFAELMRRHFKKWAAGGNKIRIAFVFREVQNYPPPPGKDRYREADSSKLDALYQQALAFIGEQSAGGPSAGLGGR